MVTTVEVGGYNLPANVLCEMGDVVGKYAAADFSKGDYILAGKVSDTPPSKNAYFGKLDGTNRALSVTIQSFAAGLSGKLGQGDVISLIANNVGEFRETVIPPELQYVEVLATTISDGTDSDEQEGRGKGRITVHRDCPCYPGAGKAFGGTGTGWKPPRRVSLPGRG